MSKTVNVVVVALKGVVTAASNVAGSSAELTAAACHALVAGAHVSDVIAAVQAGYEEKGQMMPQGMSSNLRRLAAADAALVETVGAAGYALNNKTLEFYGVPKLSTKGRTAKAAPAVAPITATGAGEAPSAVHRWVQQLNALSAGATALRNAKEMPLSAEDATALKDALSPAIALLGKYTAA